MWGMVGFGERPSAWWEPVSRLDSGVRRVAKMLALTPQEDHRSGLAGRVFALADMLEGGLIHHPDRAVGAKGLQLDRCDRDGAGLFARHEDTQVGLVGPGVKVALVAAHD